MAYNGPYGSVAGVNAYVRHMKFDQPLSPTTADVEGWLMARAAQLTGWLAAAGYVVPIDDTTYPLAKAALDRYANLGAACDAELSQRSAGYEAESQNQRENKFCAEFGEAKAWIDSGALDGLGVPTTTATVPASSLSFVRATYGRTERDEYSQ